MISNLHATMKKLLMAPRNTWDQEFTQSSFTREDFEDIASCLDAMAQKELLLAQYLKMRLKGGNHNFSEKCAVELVKKIRRVLGF